MNADVKIRGLFTLVRHSDHSGGRVPDTQSAEPMTLLFPTGGVAGHHHALFPDEKHEPVLLLSREALEASTGQKLPIGLKQVGTIEQEVDFKPGVAQKVCYHVFDLSGWTLHLPDEGTRRPVSHPLDVDIVRASDPQTCDFNNPMESLSFVPCLNTLTEVNLGFDPAAPSELVDTAVELSGGSIRALKSTKPLGNGFFEFYSRSGTIAVQQAVEDLMYSVTTVGDELPFALSKRSGPDVRYTFRLKLTGPAPIALQSLPNKSAVKHDSRRPFHHFAHYYPLMEASAPSPRNLKRREPLLRYLGLCTPGNTVSNLVPPGLLELPPEPKPCAEGLIPFRSTDGPCPCFCSQVFDTRRI